MILTQVVLNRWIGVDIAVFVTDFIAYAFVGVSPSYTNFMGEDFLNEPRNAIY